MKKLIVVVTLVSTLLFASETEKLPPDAKELISKLSNWELDQQVALQKAIHEKRAEVVSVLQIKLAEATQAGNLDGALAIRNAISKLSPAKESKSEKPEPEPEVGSWTERKLRDTVWQLDDGDRYVLRRNGELETFNKNGENTGTKQWSLSRDGKLEFIWNNESSVTVELNPDGKSGRWKDGRTLKLIEPTP